MKTVLALDSAAAPHRAPRLASGSKSRCVQTAPIEKRASLLERIRKNRASVRAKAADPLFRWKGRWLSPTTGLYDVRARQWSPGIGAFVQVDEFGIAPQQPDLGANPLSVSIGLGPWSRATAALPLVPSGLQGMFGQRFGFHDPSTTLWGWPGMNPIRFRDPSGRGAREACVLGCVFAYILCPGPDWLCKSALEVCLKFCDTHFPPQPGCGGGGEPGGGGAGSGY